MTRKPIFTAILAMSLSISLTLTTTAQTYYDDAPYSSSFMVAPTGRTFTAMPEEHSDTAKTESNPSASTAATNIDFDEYASKAVTLINTKREKLGLSTLSTDDTLTQMAQTRADELIENFSHTRPDGRKPTTVFADFDCNLKFGGENIASGQKTPQKVVTAWLNSKSHRECMLDEDAEYIAVACATDENGRLYWANIYAKQSSLISNQKTWDNMHKNITHN